MKKIAIIGTNGLPGRYGGWDQLMEHITKLLSSKYLFFVYCTTHNVKARLKKYNNSELVYIPLRANGWQSVFYDIFASIHALFNANTIILLGGAGTIMFPIFKLFRIEVIYHPDGIEWKRQKWSKAVQLYLKWLERIGIFWCDKIISDNIEITKYLINSYKKDSYLIEYGADHVLSTTLSIEIKKFYKIERGNYAFKVCRIEPENNLDLILDSFKNSKVRLIVVGNWNNSIYGIKLRKSYSGFDNMSLLDPIYNQEKLDELRSNCGIYIHGHSVGGTNPSLVEAMYLGLNVVAFDVSFNRATTENSALYFRNVNDLKSLMTTFYNNNAIFDSTGQTLRKIAYSRYLWREIILKYDQMISSVNYTCSE